jgi:hypothetical protein
LEAIVPGFESFNVEISGVSPIAENTVVSKLPSPEEVLAFIMAGDAQKDTITVELITSILPKNVELVEGPDHKPDSRFYDEHTNYTLSASIQIRVEPRVLRRLWELKVEDSGNYSFMGSYIVTWEANYNAGRRYEHISYLFTSTPNGSFYEKITK